MNRSGYTDDYDCDDVDMWAMIRWSGAFKSAIRGRRGQKLLKDLLSALDSMPKKTLIANDLQDDNGNVCALGALGIARGLPITNLNPEDHDSMAKTFDCAPCLIQEIEFVNDDDFSLREISPEERWRKVRKWVLNQLKDKHPLEQPELPPGGQANAGLQLWSETTGQDPSHEVNDESNKE